MKLLKRRASKPQRPLLTHTGPKWELFAPLGRIGIMPPPTHSPYTPDPKPAGVLPADQYKHNARNRGVRGRDRQIGGE